MELCFAEFETPLGELHVSASQTAIQEIAFGRGKPVAGVTRPDSPVLKEALRQLRAYFAGELEQFDLPLAPKGTDFQMRVWNELCRIHYGETISYGELARRIGNPQASRAVGLANGSNPIPIIIPCHRVIGSDGKLTGYGGGLPIKGKLLALERRQLRLL
ncbi:MAG TPA: methylated-DNA--[protein]-cysteine S-methyltransferase [Terriglobales bacterium]|jgi:methylated-DNA-[protein]-cysteine S-methyltransferase